MKNEKIDIIRWSEKPEEFIVNALAPAKIVNVQIEEGAEPPRALVVVPDDQLSLAIGREGQNVRLAAKLTGFKLDIEDLSQIQAEMAARSQQQAELADSFAPDDFEAPQVLEAETAFAAEAEEGTVAVAEEGVDAALPVESPAREEVAEVAESQLAAYAFGVRRNGG